MKQKNNLILNILMNLYNQSRQVRNKYVTSKRKTQC